MSEFEVWLEDTPVARLSADGGPAGWRLHYLPSWAGDPRAYPLSPSLPLPMGWSAARGAGSASGEVTGPAVYDYFDALLPSGAVRAAAGSWRSDVSAAPTTPVASTPQAASTSPAASSSPAASTAPSALSSPAASTALSASTTANAFDAASPSNAIALLTTSGQELLGAVRVLPVDASQRQRFAPQRPIRESELVERLQRGEADHIAIWDDAVRSVWPGDAPTLALYVDGADWSLVDAHEMASTHLLQLPRPFSDVNASVGAEEVFARLFCMRLAEQLGIAVAKTSAAPTSFPAWMTERIDRVRLPDGRVRRRHVVNGVQALGWQADAQQENMEAHTNTDANTDTDTDTDTDAAPAIQMATSTATASDRITPSPTNAGALSALRTPAVAALFGLLDASADPLLDRRALVRRLIFQVLIGDLDLHADRFFFYVDHSGLHVAPALDLSPSQPTVSRDMKSDAARTLTHHLFKSDFASAPEREALATDDEGNAIREASVAPISADSPVSTATVALDQDDFDPAATAEEWTEFAVTAGVARRYVAQELRRLCEGVLTRGPACAAALADEIERSYSGDILLDRDVRSSSSSSSSSSSPSPSPSAVARGLFDDLLAQARQRCHRQLQAVELLSSRRKTGT